MRCIRCNAVIVSTIYKAQHWLRRLGTMSVAEWENIDRGCRGALSLGRCRSCSLKKKGGTVVRDEKGVLGVSDVFALHGGR